MAENPQNDAGDPHLKAQPQGGGDRAVDDGDGARRAAQEDRLGQRAVQRRLEPRNMIGARRAHQTSAPQPNEKKLRKNELAAKAMLSPNTIWISRRKTPLVRSEAHTSELQ